MGRTITILFLLLAAPGFAQETSESLTADAGELAATVEELNKELARAFYEDLWFSDNTDRYGRYLAEEYVVHDIGERKAVVEPAIEQKRIADFFHSRGRMTGSIDYQIAEGDLVATRWQWKFEPEDLLFRLLGGREQIPIINVFRFDNGRIVEIWNHRHDIDTGRANLRYYKGLATGLLIGLAGWVVLFVLWRRARRAAHRPATG